MDQRIKKGITRALLAAFVWSIFALQACHTAARRMPDLSIKRILVGNVQLAIKEDQSWLTTPQNDWVGFRIRIDYPSDKAFSAAQNSEIDFGIQDNFSLVSGRDTLKPVFFQRIAGGTKGEAEYVAAFQPNSATAQSLAHCRLLFQDPLFGLGNQVINF